MEDLAVYGYVTPMKMKMVVALALADTVVRDADIVLVRQHSLLLPPSLLETSSFNRSLKPSIQHTTPP